MTAFNVSICNTSQRIPLAQPRLRLELFFLTTPWPNSDPIILPQPSFQQKHSLWQQCFWYSNPNLPIGTNAIELRSHFRVGLPHLAPSLQAMNQPTKSVPPTSCHPIRSIRTESGDCRVGRKKSSTRMPPFKTSAIQKGPTISSCHRTLIPLDSRSLEARK